MKLHELINQDVTVKSASSDDPDSGELHWSFNGKLEAPVDDDPNYYLRVKDCYQGTSGINSHERHIKEIYRQASGRVEITLR